MKFKIKCKKE